MIKMLVANIGNYIIQLKNNKPNERDMVAEYANNGIIKHYRKTEDFKRSKYPTKHVKDYKSPVVAWKSSREPITIKDAKGNNVDTWKVVCNKNKER